VANPKPKAQTKEAKIREAATRLQEIEKEQAGLQQQVQQVQNNIVSMPMRKRLARVQPVAAAPAGSRKVGSGGGVLAQFSEFIFGDTGMDPK